MIITIDGLAGSGKSTVARKLANRLAFLHLNSGALFRSVGLFARESHVPLDDDAAVAQLARKLRFRFELSAERETLFFVNDEDISSRLAQEEVGALASQVALLPSVRQSLLEVQRDVARTHSMVVEGRDSGTVVFPDAEKKFYLTTSLEVRARRRSSELRGTEGADESAGDLDKIRDRLAHRDLQDETRELAPLRKPEGAVTIDTSELTPDEVVDLIVTQLGARK